MLESTKAAADIYFPISGTVIKINELLKENVAYLNENPEEKGWLYQIDLSNRNELKDLLSEEEYQTRVRG